MAYGDHLAHRYVGKRAHSEAAANRRHSAPAPAERGTFDIRARTRAPSGSGPVQRGRTAGLPRRFQTDPREHLAWQDLLALMDAERFAAHSRLPLTAHLTVTWRSAPGFKGTEATCWESNHRAVLKALTSFLEQRGVPVAYLYARERVVGRGAHTHFLVHIPRERWHELKPKLKEHLFKAGHFTDPQAVEITGDKLSTPGMIHASQRLGLLTYLGKAINPKEMIPVGAGIIPLSEFLGIRPEAQARLPCMRVSWSQNIGEKARKDAGWRDMKTLLDLANALSDRAPRSKANTRKTTGTLRG